MQTNNKNTVYTLLLITTDFHFQCIKVYSTTQVTMTMTESLYDSCKTGLQSGSSPFFVTPTAFKPCELS